MRVYLAGPMTWIPAFNFPAFDRAAAVLRSLGHEVISPAELDDAETRRAALRSPDGAPGSDSVRGETWADFLARDMKLIAGGDLDGVVCLPGWETSRGARLETFVAAALCDLPVYTFRQAPPPGVERVEERCLAMAWTRRAGRGAGDVAPAALDGERGEGRRGSGARQLLARARVNVAGDNEPWVSNSAPTLASRPVATVARCRLSA